MKVQNDIYGPLFMERGKKGLDQDPDWSEVLVPQFYIELSVAVRFAEFRNKVNVINSDNIIDLMSLPALGAA